MQEIFLGLGDVALAFKFGRKKIAAKCFKGNIIYRGKFHFEGKLHDFKEIFLGYVAFIGYSYIIKNALVMVLYLISFQRHYVYKVFEVNRKVQPLLLFH